MRPQARRDPTNQYEYHQHYLYQFQFQFEIGFGGTCRCRWRCSWRCSWRCWGRLCNLRISRRKLIQILAQITVVDVTTELAVSYWSMWWDSRVPRYPIPRRWSKCTSMFHVPSVNGSEYRRPSPQNVKWAKVARKWYWIL